MSYDFKPFSKLTEASFQRIAASGSAFVVDGNGEALWTSYLAAFPQGTNPLFVKRTEHDCACCRQFVRRVGLVVSVDAYGNVETVWDEAAEKAPYPYNIVAAALAQRVRDAKIVDIFRSKPTEPSFGQPKTRSMSGMGQVIEWDHFHSGKLPESLLSKTPDKDRGEYRTKVGVFERGLTELKPQAVEEVLDLISSKAIYRGAEFQAAVTEFKKVQKKYLALKSGHDRFVWLAAKDNVVAHFKNTVIGTLVQDLSEGVPLEKAVAAYESKVAPQNYKRTSALVTPAMVKKAMDMISTLGLEPALERRFARISDVNVNDVLWVDSGVKSKMKGGLEGLLMQAAAKNVPPKVDEAKAEPINIDDFISKVVPSATALELLLKNTHQSNLMSLTAPVHPEPVQLFKWNNDFAWSYVGNIADSDLRRAVQARGGRVDGAFRFSHSWNHKKRNASLMDLHVFMPGSDISTKADLNNDVYGNEQRVGWNHRTHSKSGGIQDVDYTLAAPVGYIPVENITFPDLNRMPQGDYICKVHNWQLRQPTEGGFRAEIEFAGQVFTYEYDRPLKHKEWVRVATVNLKDGVFTITHHLPCGSAPKEKWGLLTEQYVKVNAMMYSPNYWGENRVGNKHYFFVLEGAKNDEAARGIYNEFLHPRFEEHRKVFELIGEKTKCQPTEGQLSGLGFSSTQANSILVKVTQGQKQHLYNVKFAA